MKKFVIALSAVIALSLVTGCGKSKTLKCKMSEKETGYSMVGTETIVFNGSKVEDYSADFVMELDETYLTYKDKFVELFEKQMSSYKEIEGVTLETKKTDNGVKITMKADVQDMTDAGLSKLNLKKKASYSATKKDREKSGYECK